MSGATEPEDSAAEGRRCLRPEDIRAVRLGQGANCSSVGEASRAIDVDLNICKQKKMTNMRSSTSDATITLAPPRELTLELALEYIGPDELLEVTPKALRIRKRIADAKLRQRSKREG